jgi:hypothetical protein
MTKRRNTLVCTFDPVSPRITAYDIHEWIYATLKLPDSNVHMIQIDGIRWQVYIKMADDEKVLAVLQQWGGQTEFKFSTGQVAPFTLVMVGLLTKRIRVTNLRPEVSHDALGASLSPYGKLSDIQIEKWSKGYRYAVEKGFR